MNLFKILFPIFGGVLLWGCGPNYIFEEERKIENSAWTYSDSLKFEFNISDTAKVYNVLIDLEHSTEYRFQNLYVKIKTQFPDGKKSVQPLSLELANKFGAWLGDCSSEQCIISIPIQQQIYFPQQGNYQIVLEQFMREDPMTGVNKFALKIEETDLKKK